MKKYGYMNVFGMHWIETDDLDLAIREAQRIADICGDRSICVYEVVAELHPDRHQDPAMAHFGMDDDGNPL